MPKLPNKEEDDGNPDDVSVQEQWMGLRKRLRMRMRSGEKTRGDERSKTSTRALRSRMDGTKERPQSHPQMQPWSPIAETSISAHDDIIVCVRASLTRSNLRTLATRVESVDAVLAQTRPEPSFWLAASTSTSLVFSDKEQGAGDKGTFVCWICN
ncbi:unnamed protein product [Fusarium fujikuroi]|uniref:Uncharacterized protein n=1 Tax=Fusarium fujikuroi TaxID=5127 RepID=A0A9Q9RS74_FUSFU|nr:unnamed protein product [Fusarium fujikuroi]VTT73479.1 unnamed protein product [Fusarium fujikuroi]VZH88277.1 unnamed protein product [Fusarium fujikuroi]